MSTTSFKTAIVLVHGAYHTSWHLQSLKGDLEKYDHYVVTPDLPSAGHLTTLQEDIDVIQDAILSLATNYERIVPVFHSYGAVPGTEALAELPDNVAAKIPRVIYLAALILPQGAAPSGPYRDRLSPWVITRHGFCAVPSSRSTFYNDANRELAEEQAAHVVVHSKIVLDTPTRFAGWTRFPGTYVVFTEDRALPERRTNALWDMIGKTEKRGPWRLVNLQGSHCPFVTRATELAQFIHTEAEESTSS